MLSLLGDGRAREQSVFTRVVEEGFGILHCRIPLGAKTWNSDVEVYHRLILGGAVQG